MEWIHDVINQIFLWLTELGYWGILLGLMIEVIPSEIVLSYGGFLVSQGKINFTYAVVYGTIGGTLAQIFLYWIGKYGGRPFLEKYGKYLLIHKKHLDLSEKWFERYGTGIIFTARFIPVVRHAISIPAGVVKMPFWKFTILTALAVLPWSVFFIYLGKSLGDNWQQINEKAEPYILPFIIIAIVLTVLYVLMKSKKQSAEKGKLKAGVEGETLTAHELKFLGPEYRVINSRFVRAGTSAQEFDHIVIGPSGIFHIDSKHWAGEIKFTEHGIERSRAEGAGTKDPTAQMYRHEYVLKELLRKHRFKAPVIGIICFTHPHCEIIGSSPAFAVVKPDRLQFKIKSYRGKTQLTSKEINAISDLIMQSSEPSRR